MFQKEVDFNFGEYQRDKKKYTAIHVHTSYSLHDGISQIPDLVKVASELGMDALSISDHGNISGLIAFHDACLKKNIKPILGCEVYCVNDRTEKVKKEKRNHLCVFVQNEVGWKNLLKIIYDSNLNFYYVPRTDFQFLAEHSEGLICTTACLGSPVIQPFLEDDPERAVRNMKILKTIFDDRLYAELQFNELDIQRRATEWVLKLSRRLNIKTVYGLDVHYTYPEDIVVQDIVRLARRNKNILDDDWEKTLYTTRRLFLKPYQVALTEPKRLKYNITEAEIEEALMNTNVIADQCNYEIKSGLHAPKFMVKGEHVDSPKFLKGILNKCFLTGVKTGRVPKDKQKEYKDRMEHELKVITQCEYCDYFLLIWDMVKQSKKRGIALGSGRGSGAGCFVSYILEISNIDPIKHGLLFERFIDPSRKDPPDIDLDWESERGNEVEKYLVEKYGQDHVAHVATWGRWKLKSANMEVMKALGHDKQIVYAMNRVFREIKTDRDDRTLSQVLVDVDEKITDRAVRKMIDKERNRGIPIVERLVGNIRNRGLHAGGTIVSPEPLHHFIPVVHHQGEMVTGWTQGGDGSEELERIGLIKIDNLKVSAVSLIKKTCELVKERTGKNIYDTIWNINIEDKKVFRNYRKGLTEGVFQLESDGITKYLMRVKPDCFADIVSVLGLYRPGTLASGEAERFVLRKSGKEPVEYIHPLLEKYVGHTYGCFIFQEQLMKLWSGLAGFKLSETLHNIKLLKKIYRTGGDPRIIEISRKFKEGLMTISNFSEQQAEKLVSTLQNFYAYVFNLSHSTAYAMVSYQTMWLKTHHPTEFFCALLTLTDNVKADEGSELKMKKFIDGAKKVGITVLPPKWGKSKPEFNIEGDKIIRAGNRMVVGVGKAADQLKKIKGETFEDILVSKKIDWAKVTKKQIETLIKAGFFEGQIIAELNTKQLVFAWSKYERRRKELNLQFWMKCVEKAQEEITDDYTEVEALTYQRDAFRFFFGNHPVNSTFIKENIQRYNDLMIERGKSKKDYIYNLQGLEKAKYKSGKVLAYITAVKKTTVKKGKTAGREMAILTLEDEDMKVKLLVWADLWDIEQYRDLMKADKMVVFRLKKREHNTYELDHKIHTAQVIDPEDLFNRVLNK